VTLVQLEPVPKFLPEPSIQHKFPFIEDEAFGEPLGYDIGDDMNFIVNYKQQIYSNIDTLNKNFCYSSKRVIFVLVAWCITRPGLWFGIEPIENVNQFKRVKVNMWAKFLSDSECYQYVVKARLKGLYEHETDWPKFGTETYLDSIYNQFKTRCVILAKGTYNECEDIVGVALVRTLRDNSKLSVHNTTCMSEFSKPFRVNYSDVVKKRKISSEIVDSKNLKRIKLI